MPNPNPTFHPDANLNPASKLPDPLKSAQIGSYSIHLACNLQIDADPDAVLDFCLMRMQIRVRI
jgi:hypothetical protein